MSKSVVFLKEELMELTSNNELMEQSSRIMRIQKDLRNAINEYPRESTGIKIISSKIEISEKTIKRILKGSHAPSYKTVLKIYRYFTGALNDRDTVLAMPKVLANFVSSKHDNFNLSDDSTNFSYDIDLLIENDSIFRFIYIESATGPIHRDKIGFEYGQGGLRVATKMLELNVIREISPNVYISSTNRASLKTESIYELSKFLIEQKFNTEKCKLLGENSCSLYFEGVTKEVYNELLIIDWEAKEKKKALLAKKENTGEVKYWSATFTDTLSQELIYQDDIEKEVLQ
jgi:hypothetical protein